MIFQGLIDDVVRMILDEAMRLGRPPVFDNWDQPNRRRNSFNVHTGHQDLGDVPNTEAGLDTLIAYHTDLKGRGND